MGKAPHRLSSPGFLSLGTTKILGGEFFVVGNCCVYCRMLSNTSGFYPLNASNISQIVTIKHCLQMLPNISWGAKSPPAEKHPHLDLEVELQKSSGIYSKPQIWSIASLGINPNYLNLRLMFFQQYLSVSPIRYYYIRLKKNKLF